MGTERDPLTIVHTEASLGWGGQEIRILTESAGMLQRGHAVTLLCPPEARIYQEAKARGVPVTAMPIGRKNLMGLRAMYRWLKERPVDVINTHSSTDSWLVALASIWLAKAPPVVRTRHISAAVPKNLPTRWLYCQATRHIVTTGENLRRQLIRENRFPPEHITSVPTGIDTGLFRPGDKKEARMRLGLDPAIPVIGIVATLRSWKGHSYLIEAFARLADKDTKLLIIGDGPQRRAINDQISALGLNGRVVTPGNQQEVLPWLQAMDVFVLPSYANEGVPQALMQAMACGLPVVTTPVGGITEAVENGTTGILVEPRRADVLQAAIQRLLEDVQLRDRLGKAAERFARENFSAEAMLDSMEILFRTIRDRHG